MNLFSGIHTLYDRVISVTFSRKPKNVTTPAVLDAQYTITIPFLGDNGLKPNIEVSLTMLPSAVCFNMVVKLTNAALVKNVDISTFQWMQVKMGYTNNKASKSDFFTEVYSGPVFSSYIEKPAPDSTIVFEGVATGVTGRDLFATNPFNVEFYASEYTIQEVCTKIADAIGLEVNFEKCSKSLYTRTLKFTDNKAYAENKFALVNWLQTILYNHFERLSKDYKKTTYGPLLQGKAPAVYVFILSDVMYVISNDVTSEKLTRIEKEKAVTLNVVKSASFTGPVLNVSALYNPALHPGDLLYMPPVYYKGGTGLLNNMDTSIYNPDNNYYRALKINVSFATTGSTNQMDVMAVPMSAYAGDSLPDEVEQEVSSWAQQQYDNLGLEGIATGLTATETQTITFGTPTAAAEEDVPPKDMWSTSWSGWTSAAVVRPDPGMTLSTLAQAQWGTEKFYLSDDQLSETFNRYMPEGVPLYYFFPLIQVATYKKMNQPGGSKTYKIDINNPDMVWTDYSVAVPAMSLSIAKSFVGDVQVANIFKTSVTYFENVGKESWAKVMTDIYNYLSKGHA